MKKMNFKMTLVAMCATAMLASCDKNENQPQVAPDGAALIGELSTDLTLKSGNTYSLTGGYHIKAGATLTIEPNVTIVAKDDNIVDYILVEQGAKINAQGTVSQPIVMTSERKETGAWGGVHVCGRAPINVTGATSKSEIGDAPYGGNDAADNSGILRYIRIEYAGYAFSDEKEANGFTFYGVGNGTTAEYLQSYKGSDDGFEWFGGTVNCRYLVSTDNTDDSFDWTEGWQGKGQFWIAYQTSADCDCLVEADNNSKNFALTPVSHPVLSNLTLVGNGSTTAKRGIRLRAGTEVEIYNTIVIGKPECLTTETTETENALVGGKSKLSFIALSSSITCAESIYSEALFTAADNAVNQTISLTDNYVGTIAGGKNMSALDSFFAATDYKGALSAADDWTKGWTK